MGRPGNRDRAKRRAVGSDRRHRRLTVRGQVGVIRRLGTLPKEAANLGCLLLTVTPWDRLQADRAQEEAKVGLYQGGGGLWNGDHQVMFEWDLADEQVSQ